jgi:hypothetical protein
MGTIGGAGMLAVFASTTDTVPGIVINENPNTITKNSALNRFIIVYSPYFFFQKSQYPVYHS